MQHELLYMEEWKLVSDGIIQQSSKFLDEQRDTHLSYSHSQKERSQLGFNAFALASKTYYRENYHSYILRAILSPKAKHLEGAKYLNVFIDAINACNKVSAIAYDDFEHAKVYREYHEIDVLIKDEKSKNAIIIENKIFDAVDQERQLPRYYDFMSKEGYNIRAIVYLPLNVAKKPSEYGWSKEDKKKVNNRLCIIPSYHTDCNVVNLYHHWVEPCEKLSSISDNAFILKHYGELIKYLNTNAMDTVSLKKFYESLLVDDNFDTAISIKNMLTDLPEYLAMRIEHRYRDSREPFPKLWREKERDVILSGFEFRGGYYRIDIWCDLDGYSLHLCDTKESKADIRAVLGDEIPGIEQFIKHDNRKSNLKRRFGRNQEKELIACVDLMLKNFKALQLNSVE